MSDKALSQQALTVTELTARIKQVLEQGFAQIEVSGEVSRLTPASSGHLYFTIKDAHAAISAVVWRTTASRLKVRPREGQAYVFIGHLSVYEPRGTYQLVVKRIEIAGEGELAAEFERRKQHFAEQGWFDSSHKLAVPPLPKHIGIVTSATAAAFEDVRKVLATRPAWLNLTLSPCVVQGNQAPDSIVSALQRLQSMENSPDLILIVRGGGSIEDLWCFNDERIVRAIHECEIPVITGIGHEIDTTLSDYAADARAATPSNAAELACPSRQTLRQQLPQLTSMAALLEHRIQHLRQNVSHARQRLDQAMNRAQDSSNWALERLVSRHHLALRLLLRNRQQHLRNLSQSLHQHEPNQRLRKNSQQFYHLRQRLLAFTGPLTARRNEQLKHQAYHLHSAQKKQLHMQKQTWQRLHEHLLAMNPAHVLQRGYAMTTDANNTIISSAHHLQKGDTVTLHYYDGIADTLVTQVKNKANQ